MFTLLAQKLSGDQIENLVVGLHDARQMLHDALDEIKRYEVLAAGQVASERKGTNEDVRKAEVTRRLERDGDYQSLKEKLQDARVSLALAEAELEREKAGHAGLVAITGFLTAMVSTGQIKDQNNVEAVMAEILGVKGQGNQMARADSISNKNDNHEEAKHSPPQPPAQAITPQQPASAEDTDAESGAFMVLEVRETSNGVIRGYCQDTKGNKVAVYAKNGHGQTLAKAEGGFVQVAYRKGDKGLIATSVKLVS